jgi:hypothetical protein
MDAYMASMMLFAGNYAPQNWMECDGQRLSIMQYQALYSLLGTTYSGDQFETFMLPDMPQGDIATGFAVDHLRHGTLSAETVTLPLRPKHERLASARGGPFPCNLRGMPRIDVPPPGRAMTFPAWSEAIVAGVRARLPDVRASHKGPRLVIIRHGDREARLMDNGGFWISFAGGETTVPMSSLVDDRRDAFTVKNLSQSVAGYFDARFTRE